MSAPASRPLTTPRRARARDRQTEPFPFALARALASSPSTRAGPENQLPDALRLVASKRGTRRVVTPVSLVYPVAGWFEPPSVVREIASGGCARFKENRAKNGTHVRAVLPPMIAGGRVERCIDHGTGQTKGGMLQGAPIMVRVKRRERRERTR